MVPARAEGPPLITAAPVMGIMLGLLRGCDEADERMATLQALHSLTGQCVYPDHSFVACSGCCTPNHGFYGGNHFSLFMYNS